MTFWADRKRLGWFVVATGLLFNAACATTPDMVSDGLVLDHVTVVDVRTGQLSPNRAVVIADGLIVKVVEAGSVDVSGMAQRIDGRNRFVVPGFNDMHAHIVGTENAATDLPLMLASGITGFRQMAGAPPLLAARAEGRLRMPPEAPALLAMPGTILTGAAYADPITIAAEVDRQRAQGADFIKVVDLPVPAFAAAAQAAQANGLPFAGHLPPSVDERQAMRLDMASIEHLGPGISVLLNCSSDEAPIRTILASAPAGVSAFNGQPDAVRRMLANPLLATPPQGFALIGRVLATYDAQKCAAFAADVAASDTWMVPTLTRLEAMELGNAAILRDNPDLRFVSAASRGLWLEVGDEFDRAMSPQQKQLLAGLFASQLELTAAFDAANVKMLTGTDVGGGWIVPGRSLHREFDLLNSAGVSPLRVLQMTTLNPAMFLRREATMGTVEAGKLADLVLLDGDPTSSVANLHRVAAVVRGGRYFDRGELDEMEANAAAAGR